MLRIPITYDLECQITQDRNECKSKPEHCYITRNSKKVATIWLNPVRIEKGADLLSYEKEKVLSIVTENQYEIEEEYRRIANGW